MSSPPPAICIMGPTASGKTGLALALARSRPVHLISVDSAQVYRGMDIGTAKPDAGEQAAAPHALIDLVDPAEHYSAGRFRRDALAQMAVAQAAGRLPVLVGGTMLYFRALLHGLDDLPPRDPALREQLAAQAARDGWPALHASLAQCDPQAAARIHPNDAQRIQRALEIAQLRPRQASAAQPGNDPPAWRFLKIAVMPAERRQLHERIRARFDAMLGQGLLEEVRGLHARGDLGEHCSSMRAVGYRQLFAWLEGEMSLEAACEKAVTATRRLAKRQLTWLRSEPDLVWVEPDSKEFPDNVIKQIEEFVKESDEAG